MTKFEKVLVAIVLAVSVLGFSVGLFSDVYSECHQKCRHYDDFGQYLACMHGCLPPKI